MTAVAEKPKEKIRPPVYQMPRVPVGAFVRWYRGGDTRKVKRGIVQNAYLDTVQIYVFGEALGAVKTCRHITDPQVKDKPDATAEVGCWDFTEEHYEHEQFKADTNRRLADLETAVRTGLGLKK